jgi:hypothetical protein
MLLYESISSTSTPMFIVTIFSFTVQSPSSLQIDSARNLRHPAFTLSRFMGVLIDGVRIVN